jgi:hypothetical protein
VGRADGRAGAAVGASFSDALYFLGCILYLNAPVFKIFYSFFEVFSGSGEFQNHDPLFSGKYGRIEYVESKVVIFYKITNDRLCHFGLWEAENQYFGIHGGLLLLALYF